LIVYFGLLLLLSGTAVWLAMRDARAARQAEQDAHEEQNPGLRLLTPPVEEAFRGSMTGRLDWRFRRLIYQSGLEISSEVAFLLMVIVGLLIGGPLFIWRDDPVTGATGMLAGMALPLSYYLYARAQRFAQIREQLPDCMDLMSRAVRAGETLDQAIQQVGRNTTAPLGVEFDRASRQLDMGLSVQSAMRALTQRAPLTEMRILATTFNVQRRSGGNLATTLDRLASVVRDRLSYQRQFMAATGGGRMATIMMALVGPAVFMYLTAFQPDYVNQFYQLPGGTFLLSVAGVLEVVGLVWIASLLRNDY
jgi:tight adherence protein B